MRKVTILALACALMIIAAGAYVVLISSGASNKTTNQPNDLDTTDDGSLPHGNDTVSAFFPVDLPSGEASIALALSYPGQGQAGYNYTWNQPYEFRLVSSVLNGYQGRVLTKLFADKTEMIGPKCLIVTSGGGAPVVWHLDEKEGINIISGDMGNWTSNGTGGNDLALTLIFNRTGNFNITFQSFSLDSGKPLSVPLTVGPLRVPVTGALMINALGPGSYQTAANGTYYTVLLNVTNGWNIRYSVEAPYLVLRNGSSQVSVNLSAMSFKNQSLAAGQSTQFLAFFDVTGNTNSFRLEYRDGTSGQVIAVPLT